MELKRWHMFQSWKWHFILTTNLRTVLNGIAGEYPVDNGLCNWKGLIVLECWQTAFIFLPLGKNTAQIICRSQQKYNIATPMCSE